MLYIFIKLSSADFKLHWYVTLLRTIFEIFAVKIWDFGPFGGTAAKRGDFVSGTDMYHHTKFHADKAGRVATVDTNYS